MSYLNLSRINFAYVNLSPDRSQNAPLLLSGKRATCARFSPLGCAQNRAKTVQTHRTVFYLRPRWHRPFHTG
ncbi:MAG: hypothetical protein IPM76_24585 [Chloroflexi bacterium]|nr:hypothetical protein [Chloroflexota bacterium]